MDVLPILGDDLAKLRSMRDRLYSQNRLTGDDMRDMAQRLDLIIANIEYLGKEEVPNG